MPKSKPKNLKGKPYFYFSATLWKTPPIHLYTMQEPPFYFIPNPTPFAIANERDLLLPLKISVHLMNIWSIDLWDLKENTLKSLISILLILRFLFLLFQWRILTPLTICSYHVTYAFQSESTLYSCLNVKELLAQSRRKIWSLSDCNWTRTQKHLVRKRTLNHLAKLVLLGKWLSVRLRTK